MVGAAAAVLAVLTTLYVPDQKIPKGGKFDWFSFLAVGMGCVCMLMVLIYGETDGWTAPGVLAWMYGGFCSFALAFISCMTHRTPPAGRPRAGQLAVPVRPAGVPVQHLLHLLGAGGHGAVHAQCHEL
jgi:hypothetical protein